MWLFMNLLPGGVRPVNPGDGSSPVVHTAVGIGIRSEELLVASKTS